MEEDGSMETWSFKGRVLHIFDNVGDQRRGSEEAESGVMVNSKPEDAYV